MTCRPIAFALLLAFGPPALAELREVPGIPIPIEDYMLIEDWGLPLRLSGAGVVSRSYLPLYAIALYVERGELDGTALAQGREPCRLTLHWLTPELTEHDAFAYWNARFDTALPDAVNRDRLRPSLDRIAHAFGAARRGDVFVLDYDPDRGLRMLRNGTPAGQFAGLEVNRVVLGLWLGAHAPGDVRNALLGLPPPVATE